MTKNDEKIVMERGLFSVFILSIYAKLAPNERVQYFLVTRANLFANSLEPSLKFYGMLPKWMLE